MQPNVDTGEFTLIPQLANTAAVEVIPMRSAPEKLALLRAHTTVTVTCSPKLGLDATLDLSHTAVAAGHRVVPHLAARQISSEKELADIVDQLTAMGVRDVFVIGGDAATPSGEFGSSAELLEAIARGEHAFDSVGVGCYPEGHSTISDDILLADLLHKQRYATYMVSQLCFSAPALITWLQQIRTDGVSLPLRLGLAAPLKTHKLVEISLKVGVGSSLRFLTKQKGFVGNLLVGSTYRPELLLEEMSESLSSTTLGIEGLHLFSFNQVAEAVAWQRRVGEAS
ncbi:methylenetetrahydrofolate reductase [Nocardia sp. NPDC051911]|uniref:methylenetetrahydrofolate reductase n=1 Tax=Nocardia sp. NPDC051911 TaxID=3154648 RepID=UPI003427F1D2